MDLELVAVGPEPAGSGGGKGEEVILDIQNTRYSVINGEPTTLQMGRSRFLGLHR